MGVGKDIRNERRRFRYAVIKRQEDDDGNALPVATQTDINKAKNKYQKRELFRQKEGSKRQNRNDKIKDIRQKLKNGEAVVLNPIKTIETMRRQVDSIISEEDSEIEEEIEHDEFHEHFSTGRHPKIMLLTMRGMNQQEQTFVKELQATLPNCFHFQKSKFKLRSIAAWAAEEGYTDLIVLLRHSGKPKFMYIVHLPGGPTSCYRISGIINGAALTDTASFEPDEHPEIVTTNFTTRDGLRVQRQLASLVTCPDYSCRRALVFHTQRDFIFFRHYSQKQVGLQEIGPRFSLKLRYMHAGVLLQEKGDYEYLWNPGEHADKKLIDL